MLAPIGRSPLGDCHRNVDGNPKHFRFPPFHRYASRLGAAHMRGGTLVVGLIQAREISAPPNSNPAIVKFKSGH
jgi:hypothetical protein